MSLAELDDDALMARTAQGQEVAFHLLVRRWEPDLHRFLVHMLGSVEEAEDLLQDTFVKVYHQAPGYRAEGKFRSWVLKIAGNLARSRLRRRRLLRWIPFEMESHEKTDPEPRADDRLQAEQTSAAVQDALSRLPARQREALVLHRFQGLRYREVAEVLGTTLPGVESLIQRAMQALKQELSRKVDLG